MTTIIVNDDQLKYLVDRAEHYNKMAEMYESKMLNAKERKEHGHTKLYSDSMADYIYLLQGFMEALKIIGIYFTYERGMYEILFDDVKCIKDDA